jgi:RHS repeat-associated protein
MMRAAVTILLALVFRQSAFAYTDQFLWTVSTDGQTFPSKPAAVAHVWSLGGNYALLTEETSEASTPQTLIYKLRAPKKEIVISPWTYFAPNGTSYSNEESALANYRAGIEAAAPAACPKPTVAYEGGWYVTSSGIPGGQSGTERRTIRVSNVYNYLTTPAPHCQLSSTTWTDSASRSRSWSCPAPWNYFNGSTCEVQTTAEVRGVPLVPPACPTDCGSKAGNEGNPINAATADKFARETDYLGAGLTFARTYHSQTLESSHKLGYGWTHSYDRRVVLQQGGATPMLLVRPDGLHEPLYSISSTQFIADTASGIQLKKVGTEWVLYLNDGAREFYDTTGKLLRLQDVSGKITTLNYTNGLLTSVVGPFGHTLQLAYTNNRLSQVTNPAGQAITFSYDTAGNLTQASYPDGASRVYHYENASFPNYLTGITDESNSRFATYGYDTTGRAVSTEHAGGVGHYSFVYQTNGTVVTDPLGSSITYAFTTENRARQITSRALPGLTTSYAVPTSSTDFQRRATQKTDPRGIITKYIYDQNHLTSRTEAFGTTLARTTSYLYRSADEDLPTQIDEPGRRTTMTYDSYANVLTRTVTDLTVTPNESRTWTYTYNASGQVLTVDGPRTDVSDVTTYTYYTCTTGNHCGQVNTITNAAGHVTTYNAYNAHGQPTQITDPNGLVTTLAYDSRQRLTDRCSGSYLPACSGGELTHLDYWLTGLLKRITNPDASFIEYTYDAAHRLTQIQDGAANKITFTLDAMGNRTAENTYDPSNTLRRTHTRVFNALNQLWKDVNAAGTANVTTVFGYDNNGNQTTTNAPLSRNSTSVYDELNRLKQITDPASGVTQFGYDANDNLTSVTDPRTLVTSYTYSGFGDLKTQTSPDTGLTTNTYDSGGNLDTSVDSRSSISDYAYDALNRVTSVSFTKSGVTDQTISYSYDAGTYGKGHLTGASDADHTLAWTYDSRGRVTGKGQTVGGVTLSMGYGYNAAGQLSSTVLPSGATITYGYNANGQVTSLALDGSTTILSGIAYDPFGPITGWTWGNGTSASRGFDTDGKITQIDNANGASLKNYGYDDAFRITSVADAGNSALSWTYGYDLLDRLNSATSASVTQGWTYDANGNRLAQTGTTPSAYTNSTTSNRVSSISGSLARTYAYDNAGNTLSYAGATFTYNNRGRMATASNGGVTAIYTYNALGQRVRRATQSATALYLYDESGHLAGEYTSTGVLVQETVWLGDKPVATLRPNGPGGVILYYVHTDHLNTPRLVTDTANNIRWRWDSDAFGTSAPNEDPSSLGVFQYNLRFPGQQFDAVAGLNYNYFRDYDPAVGSYVQSDPIGIRGGLNTYAYVGSNPVRAADPFGLFSLMADVTYEYKDMFGGRTGPWLQVSCRCEQKCDKWKLMGCSANLNIRIQIADTDDLDRRKWLLHSEDQHAWDFIRELNKYRRLGEAIEAEEKLQSYNDRTECEKTAEYLIWGMLRNMIYKTFKESQDRYDGINGPHNRLLGPSSK